MKTQILFVVLLSVLVTATGCSRFRGLRRNDYALMKDPFSASPDGDAENGEPPVDGMQPNAIAVAQVSATDETATHSAQANYENVQDDAGFDPQPAQPGEASSAATANSDALNPFTNVTRTAASGATADMAAFLETQSTNTEESAKKAVQSVSSDFSQFAEQKTQQWAQQGHAAAETGAEAAAQMAAATVDEAAGIFDNLTQPAGAAAAQAFAEASVATPLIDRAAAFKQSADASPSSSTAAATPPIGSAAPFAAKADIAGPLGPQGAVSEPFFDSPPVDDAAAAFSTNAVSTNAAGGDAAGGDAARGHESVAVTNPFSAFEDGAARQPATAQSNSTATSKPAAANGRKDTLDAGFSFDSGWRPPEVEQQ